MSDFLFARRRLLFFLVLVLGSVALRWPAMDRQIWNLDEGSTTTMAELILHGQIPFRDAADNRTPLVPYLKAIVLAVAGEWNVWAIHFTLALMIGATAALLWQIGRRLGREPAGVFAALSFFWLSASFVPPFDGLTAHTGWFVVFFSALGFWLFTGAFTRMSRWATFGSGLAFGFSYLAKQPGLLDFGVCLVIVLLAVLRGDPARAWRLLPPLVLGFLIPLAGTIAYFAAHGALDDLIFYSWTYNTQYYVPEVPLARRLNGIYVPFQLLAERVPVARVLVVLAWLGMLWTALRQLVKRPPLATLEWLILGWSATGLLSTMLSGRDFPRYSIQVVPGVSLACGWVLAAAGGWAATRWQGGRKAWSLLAGAGVAGAILSFAVPAVQGIREANVKDDTSNPIVGGIIQERSRPTDRIFIWGYMPEMHVFAKRLPSTRFFYTNWVTGLIPWTNADWFTDTAYAVIPGSPEQLRADFELRPPTMFLDTGGLRGYLKYPLREQAWLWDKVRYEFAEVDPDVLHPWGFKLYQRIAEAPYGAPFPTDARPDARVTIATATVTAPADTAVTIGYPAGTDRIELYKDNELYRRLTCPPGRPGTVIFTVAAGDLPQGTRQFQALAHGRDLLASAVVELQVQPIAPVIPKGPALEFDGQAYPPLSSYAREGINGPSVEGTWTADAPAKFVYERPVNLYGLEIQYKMADILSRDPDRWWTDGIDFAIEFESRSGKKTMLYRRHLDARYQAADRGLQKASVLLPLNEPGRIVVWFSPGSMSDSSSDWGAIKSVRGIGAPLSVLFRGQPVSATHVETPYGLAQFDQDHVPVLMLHAPSAAELPLLPGMQRLTGVLGLLPAAWNGPKGSAGAVFEVWHLPPGGEPKLLHTQLVDPGHNPAHRGLQRFSVALPQLASGSLRLVTRPAQPGDNSFNYTYWGDLAAEEYHAVIATPEGTIPSSEIQARYGYAEMGEGGQTVTFAHAPSRMVFPLPRPFARLRGEIGLIAAAYGGSASERTAGARFVVEYEEASGRRTVLWQRDLDPQDVAADRGFLPFSVDLPATGAPGRVILRTDARDGQGYARAWTYWHNLHLEP